MRPSRAKRIAKFVVFFIAMFVFLLVGGGAIAMYSLMRNLPSPERITERSVAESTKIFDRTGAVLLYEIHGEEKRTVVSLKELPPHLTHATLAAEDIRFYQHGGIDWRGILRAAIANLRSGNIYLQGGSTITQQLVKTSLLGSQKTFQRKFREQILAILLERKYSKEEILELYLNQIPYGSNAYGIAAAAQTYLGKDAKNLTLDESALLAALTKAPTYYSPYGSHRDELLARRNWILARMQETRFITEEETRRAIAAPLRVTPPKRAIVAPHFVLYVREQLNQKYGEEFVERGGLRVVTTLDVKLQEEAERAVREGAARNEQLVGAMNAAIVAIDPKNGHILAMVGSRDYWRKPQPEGCNPGVNCQFDPQVNVTTRARQPGSAFKPFVYATAFKKGYTPETTLFDVPTEFNPLCNADGAPGPLVRNPDQCYHPQNYDRKFRGPVTVRQSLAQSLNVPSVKLLYLTGVKDSIETARNMGITTLTDPDRYGLSLVLGGAEVTLLELTSAFGALAQDGILHPKIAIVRIENSKGVIVEESKDVAMPVLDTEIARTLNDILSDNDARVPVFSPTSSLFFPDRRVAAKTGTTQDFRDAWTVGYTPSLVAGVWVGNNDNTPMKQSAVSIMVAGPIWHSFLEKAVSAIPPEDFPPPAKKLIEKPILRGLYRTGLVVKIDKISRKLATEHTPPELVEEVGIGEVASILSQVMKEDPLGPPPEDPFRDPQYPHWKNGLEAWLATNPLPTSTPPQEADDLHVPEKKPKLALLLPQDPAALKNTHSLTLIASSAFPLQEVSLSINDEFIGAKTSPILTTTLTFSLKQPLAPGAHRIKTTAYDAVGNREIKEETIVVP